MKKQLQKAMDLASKTGDKIIVVNDEKDSALVVMSLDDYEKLLTVEKFEKNSVDNNINDLTEEELLDKINSDIISWKNAIHGQKDEELKENFDTDLKSNFSDFISEISEEVEKEDEEGEVDEDENMYYYEEPLKTEIIEPTETEDKSGDFTSLGEELKSKKSWNIPSAVKNSAEEVIE